jgi:ribonuclease VapC
VIIDTSIIASLALREPTMAWVRATLESHDGTPLRMSWVNIAEVAIILGRYKDLSDGLLDGVLARIGIEALPPDRDVVRVVGDARHRLPLNFGDCFAYAHAKLTGEPLLTLDSDFLKTDLTAVLHPDA